MSRSFLNFLKLIISNYRSFILIFYKNQQILFEPRDTLVQLGDTASDES